MNANPCAFLLAFDYVLSGGSTSATTPVEHPEIAMLQLASDTSTPPTLGPEKPVISRFTCENSWTVEVLFEVSEDAWDQTDSDRPSPSPFCALFESASRYIEVLLLPASNAVRFRWGPGSSDFVDLTALSGEKFVFLRGSQVTIGVSRAPNPTSGSATSGIIVFSASVGGSSPNSATVTIDPAARPTEIRLSNIGQDAVCPILCYGARIDISTAKSAAQMASTARSLGMLYQLTVPSAP